MCLSGKGGTRGYEGDEGRSDAARVVPRKRTNSVHFFHRSNFHACMRLGHVCDSCLIFAHFYFFDRR